MCTIPRSTDLKLLASTLTDVTDRMFSSLQRCADDAAALWRKQATNGTLSIAEVSELRPSIQRCLVDETAPFEGAGFSVDPAALRDAGGYQEWWRPAPHGGYEFVDVNHRYLGEEPYDYLSMSWFQHAAQGLNSIRGPYIDYAGSDLYALTFAVPADVDGRFIGASVGDLSVSRFEKLVVCEISRIASGVVVVNASDRVVVSTSADYFPGERMRIASLGDARVGGAGVGWRLHRL